MEKKDSEQEGSGAQPESVDKKENDEPKGRSKTETKTETAQYDCWYHQWWGQWTTLERAQVVFNGLLTVFTMLYALITWYQFSHIEPHCRE
jgi:hypothetical protein